MGQAINIIKKSSATATLRAMQRTQTIVIPHKNVSESSVRSAASRLKKEGYSFACTCNAIGIEVLRIK